MFGPTCTGDTYASQIVCITAFVLTLAIIARAIMSWFNLDPRNPLVQILSSITDPIIEPIRRIMPRLGMFDLSPLVALLLLNFISRGLQEFFG
ncbi:MAG TPA: YggT family protein [Dehalococcoidia bacterium]